MKVYTINDSKAEFYQSPFFARTNDEAKRLFAQAVNDVSSKNNQLAQSPSDFTLFGVGSFDEVTGLVTAITPSSLGNGLEFKKPTE